MDPVSDLLRESGRARSRTQTSGSLARKSDHQITEAVHSIVYSSIIFDKLYQVTRRPINRDSIHPLPHSSSWRTA
jgi:hypothetical protein